MKQLLPSFLSAINLKSFVFLALAWLSLSFASNAQNTKNNHTGNWENTNTWIGGVIPSAVNGAWFISTVEGFVVRNGDMLLANDATISLTDTLVVMGDLTLSGSGKINVSSNGLLVVVGDYTSFNTGAATIDNDNSTTGRVVITGNYTQTQGQVSTGNAFYVYDTTHLLIGEHLLMVQILTITPLRFRCHLKMSQSWLLTIHRCMHLLTVLSDFYP
jgi:hypothetical protein